MVKITNFPEALDTALDLPDISAEDRMNAPELQHDVQHTTLNQAVIALQRKVGANGSEDEDSLDYKVRQLEEHGGGGAGLEELEDQNPMFVELNPSQTIPANPTLWLEVVIAGEKYAVPAFKVIRPPEPPGNFDSKANSIIYYPKELSAANQFEGEFYQNNQFSSLRT